MSRAASSLMEEVRTAPPRSERARHLLFLSVTLVVFVMAWALEVRPDERVQFRIFPGWPLPQSCYSRSLLGVPCPGCGLTRSFIYLVRGQWLEAWNEHRLGWLLASIAAFQLPYRAWALWNGRGRSFSARFAPTLAIVLTMLLIANWVIQQAMSHWQLTG